MKNIIIEQAIIAQNNFMYDQDARSLVSNACYFLSLTLQPKELIFCSLIDEISCFARQKKGQALTYYELPVSEFTAEMDEKELWRLAKTPATFSQYIAVSELISTNNDNWYCMKLNLKSEIGLFIFIQAPDEEEMKLWKTEPLLAAVIMQFSYKLQQFQLNKVHKVSEANRDKNDAALLQKLKNKKEFINNIQILQHTTLKLAACPSLDKLYQSAVEALRNDFGFDRSCLFLVDQSNHSVSATYGTDEQGNTTDESSHSYDIGTMVSEMLQTAFDSESYLAVVEDTPLYTIKRVVGQGWNAMVILREGDNVLGWVALDNLMNQKPLLDYQRKLLIAYGTMLSQAIIRKREETNLNFLHYGIIKMSSQKSALEICHVAVQLALEQLKLDRVAIFLTDNNGKTQHGTYGTDINGNIVNETYFKGPVPNSDLTLQAINKSNHLAVEDPAPLYHDGKIVGHGWNAVLQLRSADKVVGFMTADNLIKHRPLTGHLKQLIRLFGANLAELLARKRTEEALYQLNNELECKVKSRTAELAKANTTLENANDKLAKLSLVDGLTGVANRRCFDIEIERAWNKACRTGGSISVVMLDADNFKSYNDHYGHVTGDECLKSIAQVLTSSYRRAGELVARYGGEEFVILISDASNKRVVELTDRAINKLAKLNIEHLKSEFGFVTISAGIASADADHKNEFMTIIQDADSALYEAKALGKNQLCEYAK